MRKENGRSMVVGERKKKRGRAYESILNILLVDELENLLIGKDEVTGEKAAFPSKRKEIKKEEKRKGGGEKRTVFSIFLALEISFSTFPLPSYFYRPRIYAYDNKSYWRSAMHKHCRNLGNTEATNLVHDCLHTERACM